MTRLGAKWPLVLDLVWYRVQIRAWNALQGRVGIRPLDHWRVRMAGLVGGLIRYQRRIHPALHVAHAGRHAPRNLATVELYEKRPWP